MQLKEEKRNKNRYYQIDVRDMRQRVSKKTLCQREKETMRAKTVEILVILLCSATAVMVFEWIKHVI